MECPYDRFGCKVKLANEDHLQAHVRDSISIHLKLVVQEFDKESSRGILLVSKVDLLQQWVKDQAEKIKELQG